MYQNILKEGNGNHNYLMCIYLQDKNFEVICSAIALDIVDMVCVETVKDKPTRKIQVLLSTQTKYIFYVIWLDKSGYLITQWQNFVK